MDIAIAVKDLNIQYRMVSHQHTTFKEYALSVLQKKTRIKDHDFLALNNVTFQIKKGESVSLIGHNGSGKSTLLKAIAGIIPPSQGFVATHGRIAPMIELGAGFDFELSGLENIRLSCQLMGLSWHEIEDKLPGIIAFADLGDFIHAPLKAYSSGMAARIGFACATAVDPDILLVDEVLAVGDQNFTKKCLSRIKELKQSGTTLVLVSHDAGTVRRFCDRALVFEQGQMLFDGHVEGALQKQDQIMDRRFLASMPKALQTERERKRRLAAGSADLEQKPNINVEVEILQHSEPVQELDVAEAFTIKLKVDIDQPGLIRNPTAFGLALTREGVVITGFNNIDLGYDSPTFSQEIEGEKCLVSFVLPSGMPQLEAGYYGILVGIHDDNIGRELYFSQALEVPVKNSERGINRHNYTIDMSKCVESINFHCSR